jgi:transposase
LEQAVLGVVQRLSERLPAVLIDTLCEQWRGLEDLDKQITEIERRLHAWMKQDEACKAIAAIPGVGGDCSSRDDG